jgi:mitogen-activated protein kinase kinase 9
LIMPWSDSNSTSRAINSQRSGPSDCFPSCSHKAASKADVPAQTPMPRPAFPVAPHEFFRRFPAAPPETPNNVPADDELRLSDLEEICHLGAGASGVVTKVRHRRTGAAFALKTAYFPDRDDQEAEALRRSAGSPHVVRCHAVLESPAENDAVAYVLELMDAGTLAGILGRRSGRGLPETALAEAAARCLQGLAHLHSRGVAHLDVNPNNVLASSQGDVKIGDFSESRIFRGDGDNRLRSVSIAVGMTAYKSPERFTPNARAGPRGAVAADVWGFGVTVLHLFLGHRPFFPALECPPYEKLREAICDSVPPEVPEGVKASAELRGFVAACLQKDPRRRATVVQLLAHPFVTGRHVEESRRALRELIVETLEK